MNTPQKAIPLTGLLLTTLHTSPQAGEAPPTITTLPETTVTAPQHRLEWPSASGNRPHHTYTEADLGVAHERTVEEVLQGEPGLSVTKTDAEGISNLHLRGAGGQGLLSLDGMPVLYSLPGITSLDAVLPDGLQSVEVDRGFAPASQAFAALGGSVRLTSRPANSNSGDLRVEGGSFGFLRETLRGTLAGGRGGLAVMASRTDVFEGSWVAPLHEGNPEQDPSRSTQVLSRSDWLINDDLHWEGSLLYRQTWNSWDTPGFYRGRLTTVDSPDAFLREEAWLTQNSLIARLTDTWTSRLQLGYTQTRNQLNTARLQLGYQTDLYLARLENDQRVWHAGNGDSLHVLWGSEGRHESATGPVYTQIRPGTFVAGPQVSDERQQQTGFLEARYKINRLSGDVGIRYEAYSPYPDQTLFHAGMAWQWSPAIRLKANGGTGFRIPSYAERLFPLIGKPGLKPERGAGGDLGVEWEPDDRLKLALTGFYHRYDDLIAITWSPTPVPERPCAGQCLFNIPRATVAGFETGGQYRFNDQWRAGISYTYNDSHNPDTGGRIPFESLHTVRAFGEWQPWQPVNLWLEVIHRDQSWNDIGNSVLIGDNLRLNARLDYRVSQLLKLYVRGENLTGNRTPHVISLDQAGAAVYGGFLLAFK